MTDLPTWEGFTAPVLRLLQDGETTQRRTLSRRIVETMALSDAQVAVLTSSGQPTYDNRIGWATSYLNRVGAIERPSRGHYRITELGRRLLTDHPEGISEVVLREHARDDDQWWRGKATPVGRGQDAAVPQTSRESQDPTDQIETGIARIHEEVAAELLHRLRSSDPSFFEDAVVKVLLKMGYGGAERRGRTVGGTGDGGIDGIIDQDALGLERIYVQAKRYGEGNSVGREAIQAFMGALHGLGASRGLFITTSTFTRGAREYAEGIPTRIVLLDGTRLVKLMISYHVGVQVQHTYDLMEIDEDFFE